MVDPLLQSLPAPHRLPASSRPPHLAVYPSASRSLFLVDLPVWLETTLGRNLLSWRPWYLQTTRIVRRRLQDDGGWWLGRSLTSPKEERRRVCEGGEGGGSRRLCTQQSQEEGGLAYYSSFVGPCVLVHFPFSLPLQKTATCNVFVGGLKASVRMYTLRVSHRPTSCLSTRACKEKGGYVGVCVCVCWCVVAY